MWFIGQSLWHLQKMRQIQIAKCSYLHAIKIILILSYVHQWDNLQGNKKKNTHFILHWIIQSNCDIFPLRIYFHFSWKTWICRPINFSWKANKIGLESYEVYYHRATQVIIWIGKSKDRQYKWRLNTMLLQ